MSLEIDFNSLPNVLLLGNGMLKLNETGISWGELIKQISTINKTKDYTCLPYAMQPESVCGVDVEEIQRRVADKIYTSKDPHKLLGKLLSIPFDAIITTNYTYEVEYILTGGKWSKSMRRKTFTALDGNSKSRNNTYICNIINTIDGRTVPVFHIHGETERKHSMILSYYSYANSLFRIIEYNKNLGNIIEEYQLEGKNKKVNCWLDYFISGNVWSVGFGLDVSEFDIWWAIERKARENASHGVFKAYFDDQCNSTPQAMLLEAMGAEYVVVPVDKSRYDKMYERIIDDISNDYAKLAKKE